jgi:5'-3' exonuclease
MGSNDFYPEDRPVHRVTVDRFWMDDHPVTNAEFRRFVKAEQMRIHLVDGTYELFRSFFGAPPKKAPDGRNVGATLGLLNSLLSLLTKSGATHVACAFDHVIESFRNDLFTGYKTSEGVASDLLAQFALAEQVVAALGVVVWPMVEFEADDALASAALRFRNQGGVEQVVICSPDKDLAQLVSGNQVVCWDRRRDIVYDEAAVLAKFGVRPASIPDWLALVGDSADGYPGISGWGPKSASAVLSRYEHLESIPEDPGRWGLGMTRALRLSESLRVHREDVLLYRRLATLRQDVPLHERIADLEWRGAHHHLKRLCGELGSDTFPKRVPRWISESAAGEP